MVLYSIIYSVIIHFSHFSHFKHFLQQSKLEVFSFIFLLDFRRCSFSLKLRTFLLNVSKC
ncbi:hypothetical protein Hanom_Chr01g00085751 [Helianthus anomalus]